MKKLTLILLFAAFNLSAQNWYTPLINAFGQLGPSSTNLFWTNLFGGTNIFLARGTNGEVTINSTASGGGGVATNAIAIQSGAGNLTTLTNPTTVGTSGIQIGLTSADSSIWFYDDANASVTRVIWIDSSEDIFYGQNDSYFHKFNGPMYGNGKGLTNLLTALTNSTRFDPTAGTNGLKTHSAGNGIVFTNQGTNLSIAISPTIVALQTDLTSESNALRTDISNLQGATNGINANKISTQSGNGNANTLTNLTTIGTLTGSTGTFSSSLTANSFLTPNSSPTIQIDQNGLHAFLQDISPTIPQFDIFVNLGADTIKVTNKWIMYQLGQMVYTNGATVSNGVYYGDGSGLSNVVTAYTSNAVTLIASNATSAQVDFSSTSWLQDTDVRRANLSLQLTNLVNRRTVWVYLTGDTNANNRTISISTNGFPGNCVVDWRSSPTNGSSDFTLTNNTSARIEITFKGQNGLGTNHVEAQWWPVVGFSPPSGGSSQTPWTSDINGGGFKLTNAVINSTVTGDASSLTNMWTREVFAFGAASASWNSAQVFVPISGYGTISTGGTNFAVPAFTSGYVSNLVVRSLVQMIPTTNLTVGIWTNSGIAAPIVTGLSIVLDGAAVNWTNTGTASWVCPNISSNNMVIGIKSSASQNPQGLGGTFEWWHQ